ncbi:MAG TPA: hypothetical protein PLJ35_15840 [Anaerolineae bacterium]|nr:hypothetical protein [Anaerolineae bacterium]HOR00283.1 hypothetical protein [Anaerolineae bacterium]
MPGKKTDQEQQAELLEVYCQRITADPSAQPPAELQPGLAETVRRLASGLTALQAEPAFAEELSQRLWAELRAPGRGQERAPSRSAAAPARWRRWARPLGALGGVAVAAALLLFVVFQPHSENGGVPGLVGRPTQGPAGPTSGPAATIAPGELPGIPPLPDWLQTGETMASDQGITLAYLRAMIHEPRFILFFIGVGGPVAADGSPYLPADVQALDPEGRAYPCQVTWLDSTEGASIGVVTLRQVDPAVASLRLQATEMRTAQGQTLRGSWQIEPIRRFQPGAPINPDQLSELDGLQCFRAGSVTIANHCYAPCGLTAQDDAPTLPVPPVNTGRATLAPTANARPATATPPPLEGAPATAVPFPTQPAAPLPPTVAPTAVPVATETPVMPVCDFTDRRHGLFGTTLLVSGPQPHAVYVLIERESGQVRRVSEQEFAEARQRAY